MLFKPSRSKEEWAKMLMVPLYREKYVETLWHTDKEDKKAKGWRLRGTMWSPWFFNMRPVGSSPQLSYNIGQSMSEMTAGGPKIDMLIAVEQAGLTLVGAIQAILFAAGFELRIGYTRPLYKKPGEKALAMLHDKGFMPQPEKVRTPLEALQVLAEFTGVAEYSQKELVEGRLINGYNLGIGDDMATDLGSKIIARLMVLWQAINILGIKVSCNLIYYFLNRGAGNRLKGLQFAQSPEKGLFPEKLEVDYIIEFDEGLPDLKPEMQDVEYRIITEFQKNTSHFQDEKVQQEVIALANRTRKVLGVGASFGDAGSMNIELKTGKEEKEMAVSLKPHDYLFVAADFKPADFGGRKGVKAQVLRLASELKDLGVGIKVNSILRAQGYDLIEDLHGLGLRCGADEKIHDIGETMEMDAALLAEVKPEFVTIMCSAGVQGMARFKQMIKSVPTQVLGVTVLTTQDDIECQQNYSCTSGAGVLRFARLAKLAEIDGLILSPKEVDLINKNPELKSLSLNTPGVRPVGLEVKGDDQKRFDTPTVAIMGGVRRVIIGRPITQAKDRRGAAIMILEEIQKALETLAGGI